MNFNTGHNVDFSYNGGGRTEREACAEYGRLVRHWFSGRAVGLALGRGGGCSHPTPTCSPLLYTICDEWGLSHLRLHSSFLLFSMPYKTHTVITKSPLFCRNGPVLCTKCQPYCVTYREQHEIIKAFDSKVLWNTFGFVSSRLFKHTASPMEVRYIFCKMGWEDCCV